MRFPTLILAALALAAPMVAAEAPRAGAMATASALIYQPISLQKTTDLAFGGIIASYAAGRVVLAPNGTRSASGGAVLVASSGVSAAALRVAGEPNTSFTLGLPASIMLQSGGDQLTAEGFTSDTGVSRLDASGRLEVHLGATLNVAPRQAPGLYAGSFLVTVAYN